MKKEDLHKLVGSCANVRINSGRRFSELHALAEKVGIMEHGKLTIVVQEGTLTVGEIQTLNQLGNGYVAIDLTEVD